LYPENASKKLNILHPEALSTNASMLGKGYKSSGHALFKSVKSTHILHFPFAFFTKTTLVSHSGYCISLMCPTLSNFCVSSFTTRRLSSLNFLLLCHTGRTFASMVRWWHKKSGSMPGMSEVVRANASKWGEIIVATSSCSSWLYKRPSLNILPPICLSTMLSTGWGCLSRTLSARDSFPRSSPIGVASLTSPMGDDVIPIAQYE